MTTHIPDGRKVDMDAERVPAEVIALCRLLRRAARGPNGERLTFAHIASLLGVSTLTLQYWRMTPKRKGLRHNHARRISYTGLFALQILVSHPAQVSAAIWPRAKAGAG